MADFNLETLKKEFPSIKVNPRIVLKEHDVYYLELEVGKQFKMVNVFVNKKTKMVGGFQAHMMPERQEVVFQTKKDVSVEGLKTFIKFVKLCNTRAKGHTLEFAVKHDLPKEIINNEKCVDIVENEIYYFQFDMEKEKLAELKKVVLATFTNALEAEPSVTTDAGPATDADE